MYVSTKYVLTTLFAVKMSSLYRRLEIKTFGLGSRIQDSKNQYFNDKLGLFLNEISFDTPERNQLSWQIS